MKSQLVKFMTLSFLLLSAGCGETNTSSTPKPSSPVASTPSAPVESTPTPSTPATSSTNTPVSSSTSTVIEQTPSVDNKSYWSETYMNPVSVTTSAGSKFNGEVADPSIVRGDDGYYYIVSTNRVMLRSEDACNWEVVTTNIIGTPGWGADVAGTSGSYALWAPDLIKIGDQWIYYYSLSGWGSPRGIGYATADNVAGPYTDQGKLFDLNEIGIQNCIDPQPFVDTDGSVYMTVGSFQGLYLVELTEDGTACMNGVEYQKENKVLIAGYDGGWDGSTYEGGYIMEKDGTYYYFGSAGTCCEGQNSTYRVYVGKADNVAGPYRDRQGRPLTMSRSGTTCGELVIWAGTASNKSVVGVGHNSILVDDAGDWWIYYHGYCNLDTFGTRHLFMDKLVWSEDGYPYVSYVGEDEDGNEKVYNYLPSFQVELDGPRIEE